MSSSVKLLVRNFPIGELYAIEVNPRPTLWFEATHMANKRITESLARELRGEALPLDTPMDQRVLWRYGLKDLASRRLYQAKECLLPASDLRPHTKQARRVNAVFRWSDPLPILGELSVYFAKAWERRRP